MGVPGLWDILRPAGESRSLTHLAVVDGFQANSSGYRGFRVGIDASIWFFHAAYGKEGENPELRTLFFRCSRLLGMPFLPVFVFDGPKRPSVKRNKRVSGNAHWLTNGMKNIIEAFGFEWKTAPGEAEAELAFLNRAGYIDAVLSDDVDTFVFGGTTVVRNPSSTLSGNRAHPTKNSAGKDDGNHVVIYRSKDFQRSDIDITQGGLILIAILSGGDYHQAGLPRCGPNIAHGLAKCGFGDSLLEAARTMPRDDLEDFLIIWRQSLCDELRTNSRGIIGRKNPSLSKSVPEDFPDVEILLSYTNPITSESEGKAHKIDFIWDRSLDLGRIANICELYFEWGVRRVIIKRFRTVIWPAAVLRLLREETLLQDGKSCGQIEPSTSKKKGQTTKEAAPSPGISKGLSSLQIDEPEGKVIVKIHSSRNHASTDGLLEYRLEIAPKSIVRMTEAGIKDIRPPLISDLEDSDDEDSDEGEKRTGKTPPDPDSHFRVWIPACVVASVESSMVEDYEDAQKRKLEKKSKKSVPAKAAKSQEISPVYGDTTTGVPTRKKDMVREGSIAEKSKAPGVKNFFTVSKTGGKAGTSTKPKSRKTIVEESSHASPPRGGSKIIKALDGYVSTTSSYATFPSKAPLATRPFPMALESDSEDLFVDDNPAPIRRRKDRSSPLPSDVENPSLAMEKSPRKSIKHTSPRTKHTHRSPTIRAPSPTPLRSRPLPSQTPKDTIIDISSDSDGNNAPSRLKSSVAPLTLARARMKQSIGPQPTLDGIIDLT